MEHFPSFYFNLLLTQKRIFSTTRKKSHASIMLPALSFPVARQVVRKSYNQGGQQGDFVPLDKIQIFR